MSNETIRLSLRHFLSQKRWHFHKNTHSWVENECCCPHTGNISKLTLLKNNYDYDDDDDDDNDDMMMIMMVDVQKEVGWWLRQMEIESNDVDDNGYNEGKWLCSFTDDFDD